MLLPENLDYWLTVVKLYGWLLSGLITAILVIGINEAISWFRKRHARKGICSLLLNELSVNSVLCEHLQTNQHFQYACWESFRMECAAFLSPDELSDLYLAYTALIQIESGHVDSTHSSEAIASIETARKRLERLSE